MARFYALDLSMLSLYLRLLPQGLEQVFSGLCLLTIPTFVCKQYGFRLVVLVYSKFTTDAQTKELCSLISSLAIQVIFSALLGLSTRIVPSQGQIDEDVNVYLVESTIASIQLKAELKQGTAKKGFGDSLETASAWFKARFFVRKELSAQQEAKAAKK